MFAKALFCATMLLGTVFQAEARTTEPHKQSINQQLRAEETAKKTFFIAPLRYAILDEAAGTVEVTRKQPEDKIDPNQIKDLEIPEQVEYEGKTYTVVAIGVRAFEYDYNDMRFCTIPNTVTIIKDEAFSGCRLDQISIPDGVVEIGANSFRDVDNAKRLEIGAKLEKIGKDAFYSLGYMERITVSEANKHFVVKNEVLFDKDVKKMYLSPCHKKSFTKFVVPGTVEELMPAAMMHSKYLKTLTLPASLKKIGAHAFRGCAELVELNLPASLEVFDAVGTNVGMTALKSISVASGNMHFSSINGSLYNKDGKTLIRHPEGNPDSLNVILPDGLERIGESAFQGCLRVKKVTIPETVKTISQSAFSSTGIKSLKLPDQLEELAPYLLYNSKKLEELHLGSRLKTVQLSVFDVCPSLKRISISVPEPPVFYESEDEFNEFPEEIEKGSTLTVIVGAGDKYRNAPQWSRFSEIKESATLAVKELTQDPSIEVSVADNRLQIKSIAPRMVEVFDLSGTCVFASQSLQSEYTITLSAGTYIVKAASTVQKVVIK